MTNNDILRRLRYTFDLSDAKMIELFILAGKQVSGAEISDWLKKEENPAFRQITDMNLGLFLDGFIIDRRGKKDGPAPPSENTLSNNAVFRKLKIGLSMKDEDIIGVLELVDMKVSKHELSAFFRSPGQKQYRPCKDQILRNFLHGLQIRYREAKTETE
jgi:uncharacterized protein YehS (DUF1456 family)